MSRSSPSRDLVVLTADKNTQFAIRGLLRRSQALGIRCPVSADYFIHPEHDPGVLRSAQDYLKPFSHSHSHALVLMDRVGSGQETLTREAMEEQIEQRLTKNGWDNRAAVVVIDPELENWVWSDSPHVDKELGWSNRQPDLRSWLRQQGFLGEQVLKPPRPKEALEAALREVRKPRSSSFYQTLAEKVGLARCTDPAFLKLKIVLPKWFAQT